MKKKMIVAAMAFAASGVLTMKAHAGWRTETYENEVTGKVTYTALSSFTHATRKMRAPYDGVRSQFFYSCTDGNESLGILFTEHPNLTNGYIHDGWNEYVLNVRWGKDGLDRSRFTQSWNSYVLMFSITDEEMKNVENNSIVRVETEWYDNGYPVFAYDLRGANKAIEKMRTKCGVKPKVKKMKPKPQVEATFDEVEEQNRAACAAINNENPMCEQFK